MRRFNSLLLNVIIIAGLMFGGLLGSLVPAATGQLTSGGVGTVPAAAAKADANKGGKGKNKHKKKRTDRKQKDRKQDRQRQRHKNRQAEAGQPVELPTGVIPDADTVDPDIDGGKLSAKDRYIVVLKSDTDDSLSAANDIAADSFGVTPTIVYHNVFEGFAAVIPPAQLDAVRNDPRVEAVVPDRVVSKSEIPTGINRIDADENTTADIDGTDERVDVDVAVIDTAGKSTHPDLNQHAWANCTPSHNNFDDDGHGTHVSGTIGALDDGPNFEGIDVVGVAPGARIWNIRVLVNGFGYDSWIICGLDLVAQYATPQADGLGDIEVANMSLGGETLFPNDVCDAGTVDPEHEAICDVVDAGVTVIVSAGNETDNAANYSPASYDEVITVSALADSDGEPGGLGDLTSWDDPDDSFAFFSNFGADVDIAAPGEDILSTVPTGPCGGCDPDGYTNDYSGTSMASPHVAGAAGLYLAANPGKTPAQVKAAILSARVTGHIPGDPDGIDEGILNVGTGSGLGTASAGKGKSGASADSSRHHEKSKHAQKNSHRTKGKTRR